MAEKKPVLLRVKRRREDDTPDGVIAVEARQNNGAAAAKLADGLSHLGIGSGSISTCSNSARQVGDSQVQIQPARRKYFRRLLPFSGLTDKDFASSVPEIFETLEAAGATKRGRTEDDASQNDGTADISLGAACNSSYEMVPKRARTMGQPDMMHDSLAQSYTLYDVQKSYPVSASKDGPKHFESDEVEMSEYVYDIYGLVDDAEIENEKTDIIPVLQVEMSEDEYLWDGRESRSSFDSQDSNDEEHYANDYPDEDYYSSGKSVDFDPERASYESSDNW